MENKLKRIETIELSLKEEPNDVFLKYALALEIIDLDRKRAKELLLTLTKPEEKYLPGFYILGKILYEESDFSQALKILSEGKELALQLQDKKAMNEISALILNIEMES